MRRTIFASLILAPRLSSTQNYPDGGAISEQIFRARFKAVNTT
jgi:hypothetical protein